ncbi:hypothetical protein NPIL_456341 [Nephila pilipes]|uniref:Uncharacterized protein n=1 Tax=Nephila pilipes TaxID=299642 RepID=A0A8X6PEQ0_NEPPI|nr:hypothetical protein NPIL_456341 [Nephila pilipes]
MMSHRKIKVVRERRRDTRLFEQRQKGVKFSYPPSDSGGKEGAPGADGLRRRKESWVDTRKSSDAMLTPTLLFRIPIFIKHLRGTQGFIESSINEESFDIEHLASLMTRTESCCL